MNKKSKTKILSLFFIAIFALILIIQFLQIFFYIKTRFGSTNSGEEVVIKERIVFSIFSLTHLFHGGGAYIVPVTFWVMAALCLAPIVLSLLSLKIKKVEMVRNIVSIAAFVLLAIYDVIVVLLLPNALIG